MTHERRRHQANQIKKLARISPEGRGVYLSGLWACRMTAGLTQRELAEAIGTNQGTIQLLKTASRGAYPKTIKRLCRALEVEPADLICTDTDNEETTI